MLFRSDRKSTRLNSSHLVISYAVFCLKKKKKNKKETGTQKPIRTDWYRSELLRPPVLAGSPALSVLLPPRRFTSLCVFFFFFNDTATTEIYTLSLHDALPIWGFRWMANFPVVLSRRHD